MEVGESEGLCLCGPGVEGGECLAAGRVSLLLGNSFLYLSQAS
jgi:hypothetical protein